ncbi:MAG: excinuclease ABC subunit UvrC [Ruminococcaceae bacterium]|nr:excinuclease ABC subunit UvrC [Oscillospiraceae bacterium]
MLAAFFNTMRTKREELREKANALPPSPGVYLMKDAEGTVIYVGKSRKLSARVASYFTGNDHAVKTARMIAKVADFDTILCDSEIEALGLENTLIKKYAPKYNVKLKDAKSYPYIAVTAGEYPRIFVTRERTKDGSRYFGPYSGISDAYVNLDTVRKLFHLPSCRRRFPEDIGRERPCIYRQMKRCMAPCVGDVTSKEYKEAVRAAVAVLSGDTREAERRLREEMLLAAGEEHFEAAARARDAIFALAKLGEKQKVLADGSVSADAWGLILGNPTDALSVLSVREGKLIRKNDFTFASSEILTPETAIAFLTDYYMRGADIPKEILLGFLPPEESETALSAFLSKERGRKTVVHHVQRGTKRGLCDMAAKNAAEAVKKETERTTRDEGTLVTLASLLALEVLPSRIEVYDISAIGKEYTTAGMIVYEDGVLKKNAYRTFRIKTVVNDDYSAMKEALTRRFAHADDESFGLLPDLILLDGGRGHVSVGKEALKEAGLDIPLFGLVKDEHHKTRALCTERETVGIAHEQSVYVFLYKLQEEVHRHAVLATMEAKGRSLKRSSLENVRGIGKERARRLLAYFGSLKRLKEASVEEIAAVRGMTKPAAASVYAHFHPQKGSEE